LLETIQQDGKAESPPVALQIPPYLFEVNFSLSAARQQHLRSELVNLVHETFIDHPDYDTEHLPEFLGSDIYMRVFVEGELTGIFTADLFRTDGEPITGDAGSKTTLYRLDIRQLLPADQTVDCRG